MKRFLKPTGRILTTAVFTSTALETLVPATAFPTPIADDPPPSPRAQTMPDDTPPPKAKTIIPPEALSNQEFAQKHFQEHPALVPFQIDVDSPAELPLPFGLDQMNDLADTSPSVPPINFAVQDIPDLANASEPDSPESSSTRSSALDSPSPDSSMAASSASASSASHSSSSESSESNLSASSLSMTPNPDVDGSSRQQTSLPNHQVTAQDDGSQLESAPHRGNGERLPANSSTSLDPSASLNTSLQASTLEEQQATDPLSDGEKHPDDVDGDVQDSDMQDDVMSATREWLDETLARIVSRDRLNREEQFRNNLIQTAHEYLAQGDVQQAKRIAENPALAESDRDELLVAIAEIESNATYPFVSADHALALSARTISDHPRPSREWLLAQMDAAVESLDPTCYEGERPALSAFAPTRTVIPGIPNRLWGQGGGDRRSGGSGDDTFRSGGEFLFGVGHQPPSMTARRSLPPRPINTSEHQPVARRENCTPTFGQNIGGVTFATLSGYQWITQFARPSNMLRMVFPLAIPAAITSHFGWRTHPIYGNRRFHFGIDFGAPSGTPILAAMPGRVTTSNYLDGYGLTVILENQELEQRTLYAHMSGIAVRPGTWIEQGDIIGWVGSTGNSTGPHLHFEVHQRQGSEWVAVDPLQAAAQLIANRPAQPVP